MIKDRKTENTNMKKILLVPYFVQMDEKIDPRWHDNSCGIVCVSMVMSFHYLDTFHASELIDECVLMGGYTSLGWIHDFLVRLLRNHGINAYSEEFRSVKVNIADKTFSDSQFQEKMLETGIKKIASEIDENRPVIVSVLPGFRNSNFNHLVLIVGYEGLSENPSGFYIHDPDNRISPGQEIFVPLSHFKEKWRKMAIFSRVV
jgi:hypothetical protein